MIGASHADSFILWAPGSLASPGLKDLAEHANTSQFEAEMMEKVFMTYLFKSVLCTNSTILLFRLNNTIIPESIVFAYNQNFKIIHIYLNTIFYTR